MWIKNTGARSATCYFAALWASRHGSKDHPVLFAGRDEGWKVQEYQPPLLELGEERTG